MKNIYANVRPGSRYSSQATDQPFTVSLDLDPCGYHWKGGPGGQYRTTDLLFFEMRNNENFQVDLCDFGSTQQLDITKDVIMRCIGGDLHSSYWEHIIETTSELLEAAKQEYKSQLKNEEKERRSEGWD